MNFVTGCVTVTLRDGSHKGTKPLSGGARLAFVALPRQGLSRRLTRAAVVPILPLGQWLSSPRRSLGTPLLSSRAPGRFTWEYSPTGRWWPTHHPSKDSPFGKLTCYWPARLYITVRLVFLFLVVPFLCPLTIFGYIRMRMSCRSTRLGFWINFFFRYSDAWDLLRQRA